MKNDYKILVVEDDEDLCKLIQKNLQRIGFHAEGVSTGKEAVDCIVDSPDVLLLMDYRLPDMTGKQVIETLVQRQCEVPFVVITGQGDEKVAVEMMKLNARDYLVKDANFLDLLPTAVNQVIDQLETEKRLAEVEKALLESEEKFINDLEAKVRERTVELEGANEELQREIIERKEIEKKLAKSNAELRLFADISAELIDSTVDSAKKMQAVVSDLLVYSQIGMNGNHFQPVDCEADLEHAVFSLQAVVEDNGAVVTHDPLPTVSADDKHLELLFQNLIDNAIRFHGDEPPRVHVSAEQKKNEWVFSVRDNGIGIKSEHADDIFAMFYRLHNKDENHGTGMGLAICKKIVEYHSGRIWVDSQIGNGSTFYFTIPK